MRVRGPLHHGRTSRCPTAHVDLCGADPDRRARRTRDAEQAGRAGGQRCRRPTRRSRGATRNGSAPAVRTNRWRRGRAPIGQGATSETRTAARSTSRSSTLSSRTSQVLRRTPPSRSRASVVPESAATGEATSSASENEVPAPPLNTPPAAMVSLNVTRVVSPSRSAMLQVAGERRDGRADTDVDSADVAGLGGSERGQRSGRTVRRLPERDLDLFVGLALDARGEVATPARRIGQVAAALAPGALESDRVGPVPTGVADPAFGGRADLVERARRVRAVPRSAHGAAPDRLPVASRRTVRSAGHCVTGDLDPLRRPFPARGCPPSAPRPYLRGCFSGSCIARPASRLSCALPRRRRRRDPGYRLAPTWNETGRSNHSRFVASRLRDTPRGPAPPSVSWR